MTTSRQILIGILGGVVVALLDNLLVDGYAASLVALSLGAILLIVGLIRGQRLPPFSARTESLNYGKT